MTATTEHLHITQQTLKDELAEHARLALAGHTQDAADFRELALMLGLIDETAEKSLCRANPLDVEICEPLPALTEGKVRR